MLVVPYVTTDQVFHSLAPESGVKYLLLCLALSSVLIIIFYFNYLFLIPQYRKPVVAWMTMKDMIEKLPSEDFMRIHRKIGKEKEMSGKE